LDSVAKLSGRRLFLLSGLSIAGLRTSTASTTENVYRFATDRCDIQVSVEFHDSYSSRGFWFNNRRLDAPFCLSLNGEKDRDCIESFVGSLAIARYEVRFHSKHRQVSTLREYVRNIDRDERLEPRSPFHRKVELHRGLASDLQAFGYKESGPSPAPATVTDSASPWYYFRQDLYLEADSVPFLIVHWKHAISAIRMLDIIPAGGTSILSR
jgi:hypothetical protein